jgi:hypothetical protein
LRAALTRLGRRHPVITARLVEPASPSGPYWQYQPGADNPLHEIGLESDQPQAVLDCAGRLLSTPCDPHLGDPLRFHLLHRPGAGDVFLMQYNHTLLDNNAAVLLLREIDRLADAGGVVGTAHPTDPQSPEAPAPLEQADAIWEYLQRFPRAQRRQAARQTIDLWGRSLRGGAVTLGRRAATRASPVQLRIVTRCLEAAVVQALRARVIRVCGFPSLSMALIASAFRAIEHLALEPSPRKDNFIAGIGIDLGQRGRAGPIFQNLASLVPIRARTAELADRDELLRLLSGQLRDRLGQRIDLGVLQLTLLFNRRPEHMRWVIEHLLRYGFSLWYAYFGALDALGSHFCQAPIENVFYTGPSWSPIGLTLLANQFRGRILLQATHVPETVPERLVHQFLDHVVADLGA